MILVDSSVWIDVLHGRNTAQTTFFRRNLTTIRWATADLVLAEVLQGARTDDAAAIAEERLLRGELIVVGGEEVAIRAAYNYRLLRSKGHTVRKLVDTLIATRCILDNIPLLFADRDFQPFVEHLNLRSALDTGPH